MGVMRAVAEIEDPAGEGLAGAVEGGAGEAYFSGGVDDLGGLDGGISVGEVVEEPASAEFEPGGWRWRLYPFGVVEGRDGQVFSFEAEGEGRRVLAEVGFDNLEAASFDRFRMRGRRREWERA